MAIPSPSIQDAHAAKPIRPLALPRELIARLVSLGWSAAELPVGAYGVVTSPVPTVAMGTSLGFHASVPAEVVFAITAAICDNPERVRAIHPAAAAFDPARAHLEPGGPLHEGAARYFEARGGRGSGPDTYADSFRRLPESLVGSRDRGGVRHGEGQVEAVIDGMTELGGQSSGRGKEHRRRGPADSQGKEIRNGLLDVRLLHLVTAELLPPGIGGLHGHQVGSEQGRVGFEQLVSSGSVRLVREPEICDRGVDDNGLRDRRSVSRSALAHAPGGSPRDSPRRHRSRSSRINSIPRERWGRWRARMAAARAAISDRLTRVPSASTRRASCSTDTPRRRACSRSRSATSSSRFRMMIVAMAAISSHDSNDIAICYRSVRPTWRRYRRSPRSTSGRRGALPPWRGRADSLDPSTHPTRCSCRRSSACRRARWWRRGAWTCCCPPRRGDRRTS